ncbi:MAG: DUF3343 domain-containing protein [Bacillota bacterium]|nr:DUF3343 domain-containing protein [Bacillota bacterium]
MIRQEQIAMVFATMHQTMEAEECLEQGDIPVQWLNVPADLGLGCGMALGVEKDADALSLLKSAGIKPRSLWKITGESWHPFFKETR